MKYQVSVFTKESIGALPEVRGGWDSDFISFNTKEYFTKEEAETIMSDLGLVFEKVDEDGWIDYHDAENPIHGDCASLIPEKW